MFKSHEFLKAPFHTISIPAAILVGLWISSLPDSHMTRAADMLSRSAGTVLHQLTSPASASDHDAPAGAIVVVESGVGFGTDNPSAPLHVHRSDNTSTLLFLEQANTSVVQDRHMMQLNNNGGIRFEFANTALNTSWRFQAATGNRDVFEVAKVGTGAIELELDSTGNLTIQGALSQSSDVNAKRDIQHADGEWVLARLAELPISEWSYKTDVQGTRHLGPMAQDFHTVFGLGEDDTKIAPGDMAGVALIAIKTLQEKLQGKEQEIAELRDRLDQLSILEERVSRLETHLASTTPTDP